MPQVGFEPMIPVFEQVKTVHVLDRAVTVIGLLLLYFVESPQYLSRRIRYCQVIQAPRRKSAS
jgi:hypothetical protein